MKRINSFKISSFLFAIFMFLPMISIFSRVVYVQSNPNAKDSYYGQTINEENYVVQTTIKTTETYYVVANSVPNYDNITPRTKFYYDNFTIIETNYNFTETQLQSIQEAQYFVLWYDSNYNNTKYITWQNFGTNIPLTSYYINFSFTSLQVVDLHVSISQFFGDNLYQIEYNDYSFLDNAFDYAISSFAEDENYNLNFFNFFDNTFLINSGHNALYLNFLNWYMNYALVVSSAFILFFVLYFFINIVRKLVLSFSNKIEGGF